MVQYALDVDKVEFDLSQDPEFHAFHYVNVGVFVLLKAYVVRNIYLNFSILTWPPSILMMTAFSLED